MLHLFYVIVLQMSFSVVSEGRWVKKVDDGLSIHWNFVFFEKHIDTREQFLQLKMFQSYKPFLNHE